MVGGVKDGAATPGCGAWGICGDGVIGMKVAVWFTWSSTMACCVLGSVMSDEQ